MIIGAARGTRRRTTRTAQHATSPVGAADRPVPSDGEGAEKSGVSKIRAYTVRPKLRIGDPELPVPGPLYADGPVPKSTNPPPEPTQVSKSVAR
jgi:hypothetical protein